MDNVKLKQLYRLKTVIRYNNRSHIKDESVAEHSFYVALIALQICDDYDVTDDIRLQCLIKSLLHDMPETELNDITHDVKNALNLRPLLKQYEDEFYVKNYPKYIELMNNDVKIVDEIVKYADTLSVKQYVLNEIEIGNNSPEMTKILDNANERADKCKTYLEEVLRNEQYFKRL